MDKARDPIEKTRMKTDKSIKNVQSSKLDTDIITKLKRNSESSDPFQLAIRSYCGFQGK